MSDELHQEELRNSASKPDEVGILITKYEVGLDPHIEVFSVEIGNSKSTWMESIPSEENLRWFLRGVQAGAQAYGNKYVSPVGIPVNAVPLPTV